MPPSISPTTRGWPSLPSRTPHKPVTRTMTAICKRNSASALMNEKECLVLLYQDVGLGAVWGSFAYSISTARRQVYGTKARSPNFGRAPLQIHQIRDAE